MFKRWVIRVAVAVLAMSAAPAFADKKIALITDPYNWFSNSTPNGELVFKIGGKSAIGLGGAFKKYTGTTGTSVTSTALMADYFLFFNKPFSNSFYLNIDGSYYLTNASLGISGYTAGAILGYWAGLGNDAIGLIAGVGGEYTKVTLSGTGYSGLSSSAFGLALRLGFAFQF